jgi:hypothetical protein
MLRTVSSFLRGTGGLDAGTGQPADDRPIALSGQQLPPPRARRGVQLKQTTTRTNRHYECANALIEGQLQPQNFKMCDQV